MHSRFSDIGSPPPRRGRSRIAAIFQLLVFVVIAIFACGGGGCPQTKDETANQESFRPYFLYTANKGSSDISMFQADRLGNLRSLGRMPAGYGPSDIAVYGDTVVVSNEYDNTVSLFLKGPDGRLTVSNTYPTGTSPQHLQVIPGVEGGPASLAVSCTGSSETVIYEFTSNTVLTEKQRLAVSSPGLAAKARNLFVPSTADNKVYAFENSETGYQAAAVPSQPTGNTPTEAVSNGFGLFVLNSADHTISTYDVGLSTSNQPLFIPGPVLNTGNQPIGMALDNDYRQNLYVISQGENVINHFKVERTELTAVGGTSVATDSQSTDLATASNELEEFQGFLYATTLTGTVRLYYVNVDGELSFQESFDTEGTDTVAVAVSEHVDTLPPIRLLTSTLPDGEVGSPYSAELTVEGGNGDLGAHFTISDGDLPPGLSFDERGTGDPDRKTAIVGTPTQAGTYTFSLSPSQPGITGASVPFTVTIAAGSGTPGKNRFANLTSLTSSPVTLLLGTSTTFGPQAYGTISERQGVPIGNVAYQLKKADNSTLGSGSVHTDAAYRHIFIALGGTEPTKTLATIMFDLDYAPPSGQAAVTVVNGIDQSFTVDVYCLVGTETVGTATRHQANVAYTDNPTFEVPASQPYQVVVTFHNAPGNVIASTPSRSITAGQSALEVVVSPPSLPASFTRLFEQ